jgi:hypothetical protein
MKASMIPSWYHPINKTIQSYCGKIINKKLRKTICLTAKEAASQKDCF